MRSAAELTGHLARLRYDFDEAFTLARVVDDRADQVAVILVRIADRGVMMPCSDIALVQPATGRSLVPGAPDYVLAVTIDRGRTVGVVDAGTLLGIGAVRNPRHELLIVDSDVAIAVDRVVGVTDVDSAALGAAVHGRPAPELGPDHRDLIFCSPRALVDAVVERRERGAPSPRETT